MDIANFHEQTSRMGPGEVLAQCYSEDAQDREILQRYFENLSRRPDEASGIAAALICFDLAANHDDDEARSHFPYLLETLRADSSYNLFREELVGLESGLVSLWQSFEATIVQVDPRFEPGRDEISIDDLSDIEIVEEEPEPEIPGEPQPEVAQASEMEFRRYGLALQDFFGDNFMYPLPRPSGGFRLDTRRDVQRVETFIEEMAALAPVVPGARIYRAWALLFYGTHMRSRGLFGLINTRKQDILREGLNEFSRLAPGIWEVAEMFTTAYSERSSWEKMMELITDYTVWLAHHPQSPGVEAYDPVDRLNTLYRQRTQRERRRGVR